MRRARLAAMMDLPSVGNVEVTPMTLCDFNAPLKSAAIFTNADRQDGAAPPFCRYAEAISDRGSGRIHFRFNWRGGGRQNRCHGQAIEMKRVFHLAGRAQSPIPRLADGSLRTSSTRLLHAAQVRDIVPANLMITSLFKASAPKR
jgi:hypothetical protein